METSSQNSLSFSLSPTRNLYSHIDIEKDVDIQIHICICHIPMCMYSECIHTYIVTVYL